MPRAVFEPATPASKRPQTYTLDRAATGIGIQCTTNMYFMYLNVKQIHLIFLILYFSIPLQYVNYNII
jgi:hypothetical protein